MIPSWLPEWVAVAVLIVACAAAYITLVLFVARACALNDRIAEPLLAPRDLPASPAVELPGRALEVRTRASALGAAADRAWSPR